MARRSQCSDAGDNPLDPNYLPPHYREEYRLAIDALVEEDLEGYYKFLQLADIVDFLSLSEIDYIQNFIQLPKQSGHPEHHFLDTGGEGSSDTYWPLHSDLDAPGLDLGWPQSHHFIGPTEVTTLVNPPAPDMPSIKEQARRLIKNAHMVIAIVMDMFTDVHIFADILNAAMRNVAVYILLDEANVDHFINMVNNCRVNLQGIQFLRVRTVSGIRYHCRSGKSFKGQMLDRFLLTDCRAVLSGNYSFMWSYEKLHRCMAHLFLGQLVSTFDEEFRILFAQSEPLIIENMEDISVLQKRPYPGERPMLGDTRKYRTIDTANPEEWPRQPYEDMDRRSMLLKRQETFHGPMDVHGRFPTQQTRLDPRTRLDPQTRLEPQFDHGPPRIPMMEGLAHKRHGFGEGGPGRHNLPYQQGFPEIEPPGRQFYRGQQLPPGHEPDYGGYDKFWNQDFHQEAQYPEPGYPPEQEPHEGFDPVLNYLSSSRNVEIDQSSDKLIPGPDLPYTTTHPRRAKVGQPYACQTSPTPSNTTEKKFLQAHTSDRKDPTVKRGLRNWRISSYLSAYEDSGEPEGLPMGQGQTIDPFEELPNPIQQTPPPPVIELSVPKIPNVREFKVPALPRASQMPAFAKTTSQDLPKKLPDEFLPIPAPNVFVPEIKTTPTPSESSSTTDGEKQEEVEQREPITSVLRRDDPFRRKYNAAVNRSSRLRSSLIFSSLDQSTTQDNKTVPGEQEENGTKTETEQTKLPFVSQVLAQRRSGAREPFEWRSYIKTTDNAKAEEDSGKQPEKGSDNKLESLPESQEVGNSQEVAPNVEKVDVGLLPKPSQKNQPQIEQPAPVQQPTKSFLSEPFVDMNDPDQRLLFFKELAAKRRAAKAAEEAKLKQERATEDKKDEPAKEEVVQKDVEATTVEKAKKDDKTLDVSGKIDKLDTVVKNDPTSVESCEKLNTKVSTDSEKIESKQSQISQPISSEKQTQEKEPLQDKSVSKPAVTQDTPIDAPVATAPANVEQDTEENQPATTTDATSKDPQLKSCKFVPDFAKQIGSNLLSSLPSARIYERSTSQEANKEPQQKSRLWSPTLHKREMLKPFADKQMCISTVVQTEEATEEPSQTSSGQEEVSQEKPSVKFNISDKTQPKQSPNEDSTGKATSATQNKEEKSTLLPTISEKTTPQQPQNEETSEKSVSGGAQIKKGAKEAGPLLLLTSKEKEKPTVFPSISEKVLPQPLQNEDKLVKSTPQPKDGAKEESVTISSQTKEKITTLPTPITSTTQEKNEESLTISTPAIKEDTKDPIQPQELPSAQSTTKDKSTVLPAKSPKQDEATTSISDQTQPCMSESSAKSSGIQTISGELPSQEKAKTEQKQSLDRSVNVKSTSSLVQVENSSQKPTSQETLNIPPTISENKKPQQPEKMEEKSNVEVEESTERSCQKEEALSMEKPDKLSSTSEKVSLQQSGKETVENPVQIAASSGKDGIKETIQLHSVEEKASTFPKEEVKVTSDSILAIPSDSKDGVSHEKSTSMMPTENIDQTDPVSQSIEEAKQKSTISYAEEFTQLESHSNTSSPSSFATALEFISSEESDMLSLARTDPHGLFKLGNVDSSVSDSSDFETPNSDFSRSPMPTTIHMDDATEDKISIAETVIKASSRRISAATEDVNMDIGSPQASQQCSPKEDAQTEPPQEHLSPETTSDTKSAIVQSEVKGSTQDATTPLATSAEVAGSDSPVQNKTAKSHEDEKTAKSELEQVASNIEVNKASVVSPSCPATSQVEQEADMADQASTKVTSNPKSSIDGQSEACKETISTNVKTQNITSQPETEAVTSDAQNELNKETIASPTNPAASEDKQDTVADKTPQVTTKETSKSTDVSNKSVDVKTTDLVVSTEVKGQNLETSTVKSESKSEKASPVLQEAKMDKDQTPEITTQKTSAPTENSSIDSQKDVTNEPKSTDVKSETKLTKVSETTPPTAQPKQQPKPNQSRYLSSTASVISSSNLRDDTKILLEQISANSQSRNETTNNEAPVTDDEKEDKADKKAKHKSLGQQKPSQDRDKLLERIQSMRKDRKVYSRFEV